MRSTPDWHSLTLSDARPLGKRPGIAALPGQLAEQTKVSSDGVSAWPAVEGGPRGRDQLRSVTKAEEADMHEQRMKLVKRHACAPAFGQRHRLGVAAQYLRQAGRAEQGEHRQVGLPVAAVRGRVDRPAAAARPQHVARPQVTVDAAWRL